MPSSAAFARFDFTVGDEPYKRDWSDTELRLHDYLAAVTLRGAAGGGADRGLSPDQARHQAEPDPVARLQQGAGCWRDRSARGDR